MKLSVVFVALYLCVAYATVLNHAVINELNNFGNLVEKGKLAAQNLGINGAGLKCLLCGIAANEIEGMLAENQTEANIIALVDKDICGHLPSSFKDTCDTLVSSVPDVVTYLESGKSIGQFCVEKNFCDTPFTYMPDWTDVPVYDINLDLAPEDRWTEACSNSTFKGVMTTLLTSLEAMFDNSILVSELGKMLNNHYFPKDLAGEIRGCAAAMDVDYGWLTFVNIGYEITDACTSIVALMEDGTPGHFRNMDFWDGIWLTNHLKNLTMTARFTKKGQTEFYATSFAGYVGILSGMRPNGFSVSIDTRYYPEGITQFFKEIIIAFTERNASLVSHLTRRVLENEHDFTSAIDNLSNDELVADVYYIVAGVSNNQGAVISRNRNNASDVWTLDEAAGRWYEVQTNYDHDKTPPFFDDRVHPAESAMNLQGRTNFNIDSMRQVLSVKPVLNLQSTFTMLAVPAQDYYMSYQRNCPYPCAE